MALFTPLTQEARPVDRRAGDTTVLLLGIRPSYCWGYDRPTAGDTTRRSTGWGYDRPTTGNTTVPLRGDTAVLLLGDTTVLLRGDTTGVPEAHRNAKDINVANVAVSVHGAPIIEVSREARGEAGAVGWLGGWVGGWFDRRRRSNGIAMIGDGDRDRSRWVGGSIGDGDRDRSRNRGVDPDPNERISGLFGPKRRPLSSVKEHSTLFACQGKGHVRMSRKRPSLFFARQGNDRFRTPRPFFTTTRETTLRSLGPTTDLFGESSVHCHSAVDRMGGWGLDATGDAVRRNPHPPARQECLRSAARQQKKGPVRRVTPNSHVVLDWGIR